MNYLREQTWLVLVELLTDLRKKGIKILKMSLKTFRWPLLLTSISHPTDPKGVEVKRINNF